MHSEPNAVSLFFGGMVGDGELDSKRFSLSNQPMVPLFHDLGTKELHLCLSGHYWYIESVRLL